MGYSRNKLKRLRYSLKSNCNRLAKKLYAIDEAVLYDYIKREEAIKASEGKWPAIPPNKKHLLKDAQRYNIADFGKYSSLRRVKTFWNFADTVKLARCEKFYKIHEVEIKDKKKTIILHKDIKTKINIEAENNINKILNYNGTKLDIGNIARG